MGIFDFWKKKEKSFVPEKGVITLTCPYCGCSLEKFPSKKTKCKKCSNYIYVRTRPSDHKKALFKENEIKEIQEDYEDFFYKERNIEKAQQEWDFYFKNRNKQIKETKKINFKAESILIDVSSEVRLIIKNLEENYKEICKYPEILKIDEKNRLPILQFIWGGWFIHDGREKSLKYLFPQYKDVLRLINAKETNRIVVMLHQKNFQGLKDLFPFARFSCHKEENIWRMELDSNADYKQINKTFSKQLCFVTDINKIADVWLTSEGYLDRYFFSPFTNQITHKSLKSYKFWINGEIKNLSVVNFVEECLRRGIKYPLFGTWDLTLKEYQFYND